PTPTYGTTTERRRFPRELIIDVFSAHLRPQSLPGSDPYCAQLIHPNFDRAPAFLAGSMTNESFRRRVLARLADGTVILQRTSASDVEATASGAPTPFAVP